MSVTVHIFANGYCFWVQRYKLASKIQKKNKFFFTFHLSPFTFDLRSSLLTLDNAQMRFGIVLAYSQPSPFLFTLIGVL